MKKTLSTLILCLITSFCFSQSDSISKLVQSIVTDSLNFKPIGGIMYRDNSGRNREYGELFENKNNIRIQHDINNYMDVNSISVFMISYVIKQGKDYYSKTGYNTDIYLNGKEKVILYQLFLMLHEKAIKEQEEYFIQKNIQENRFKDSLKQSLYEQYYKNSSKSLETSIQKVDTSDNIKVQLELLQIKIDKNKKLIIIQRDTFVKRQKILIRKDSILLAADGEKYKNIRQKTKQEQIIFFAYQKQHPIKWNMNQQNTDYINKVIVNETILEDSIKNWENQKIKLLKIKN